MICADLSVETTPPRPRRTTVLRLVGIAPSSWHRPPRATERKRPGPPGVCGLNPEGSTNSTGELPTNPTPAPS
jgi:hypothetical protein